MTNLKSRIVMGMDIGGSHVTAALVDMDKQTILPETRYRLDLDSQRPVDAILADWKQVVINCYRSHPNLEKHIGMAMPGPCDYDKGICYIQGLCKYANLYEVNIPEVFAEVLSISSEQIIMTNDAACFLQGELSMGVAQNYQRPIGSIIGTGCGTAKVHEGIGCDGELWQLPFKEGIAEDYLSTNWFKVRYQQLTGISVNGAKDLAKRYNQDPIAREVYEEFARNLADFLTVFGEMESADSIVLGGNIMKAKDYFLSSVISQLSTKGLDIPVLVSSLGEDAPIMGAAVAFEKKTINQYN